MSFSMPPSAASSAVRQAGFAFRNARHQTAKVGAERNAAATTGSRAEKRVRYMEYSARGESYVRGEFLDALGR